MEFFAITSSDISSDSDNQDGNMRPDQRFRLADDPNATSALETTPVVTARGSGAAGQECSARFLQLENINENSQNQNENNASALRLLAMDELVIVTQFLDGGSVLQLAATAPWLRGTLQRLDSAVWRPRCLALWSGKQGGYHDVAAIRGGDYGRCPQCVPRRISDVAGGPAGLGCRSWQRAFFTTARDGGRRQLTDADLLKMRWRVNYKKEQPSGSATAVSGFRPASDGKGVVFAAAGHPAWPCQVYDDGTKLQIHAFPAHTVARTADWGWRISNFFVAIESVDAVEAPASPMRTMAASRSSSDVLHTAA
jgi:hypothetical protein